MEWQPIATAPQDGTKVLGFAPEPLIDDPEFRVVVMWWRGEKFKDSEWQWRCAKDDVAAGHPTHWMPLPNPPRK